MTYVYNEPCVVSKGDVYNEIYKYVERYFKLNFGVDMVYGYIVVRLFVDKHKCNTILSPDGRGDLIWDTDWYEGEDVVCFNGAIPIELL